MDAKEGFLILLNLAILGMVIAAAVYIFQIGNGNRSVKCTALEKIGAAASGSNPCSAHLPDYPYYYAPFDECCVLDAPPWSANLCVPL